MVELVRFGETDAASTARVVLPDGGEVAAKVSKVEPVTAAGSNGR
jgi:hypothetical protein